MQSRIACLIGTGPSLRPNQIKVARNKGFDLLTCNNAIFLAPDAVLLYAVNYRWWQHYHFEVRNLPCEKWTTNRRAAEVFDLNWIAEKNAPGLSTDPTVIHHGHGSGFSLLSMAHNKGYERIVLLGYDLKYAPDYDPVNKVAGSTPRHFFGEYPSEMQHWPSKRVRDGVHEELLELYQSVADQGLVEIINCTPDSALECFPRMDIHEF